MVIFCQFLHGTCLDGIGCKFFCRVNCVKIVGGWASLVDCSLDIVGLVSDGDHPEASCSAFFTTYIFLPRYVMLHPIIVNSTVQPALQSLVTESRECEASPGMMCPCRAGSGKWGMSRLHVCVDVTRSPFGI